MAIEIHLPRKYSRETLEMLRNNDGPNVVMTPGAVEVDIERNTDKSGLPVTKQSVLDIFNKQVIERFNSLPKYSRDYYFIPTGNYGGWHDDTLHGEFVEKLGNAYLSNEYGIMAVCDYLKLSDFVDREGDITIDDLANTFTNTINKLSTLRVFSVSVRTGNGDDSFDSRFGFAIGKEQVTGLVDFNEVKDKLINSSDFNTVCKKWYIKLLTVIVDPSRRINYTYNLPLPQPSDFKFFLKERDFGRPGPAEERYIGENRVQLTAIFAHSISSVYFRIPNVTRPISNITLKINRHGGNHRHSLTIMNVRLINERNSTIVGHDPRVAFGSFSDPKVHNFGSDDGRLYISFADYAIYANDSSNDIIFTFDVTTTGDRYDASWIYAEIEEVRTASGKREYDVLDPVNDDNIETRLENVPIATINSEIRRNRITNGVQFKYTVKDFKRRIADIYFVYPSGKNFNTNCEVSLEVYRNGNKIGNGVVVYNTRPWAFHSHGWDYAPIIRVSLSNLDVKNGDELVINFNNAYVTDNAINNFRIVRVLYFPIALGFSSDYSNNLYKRGRLLRHGTILDGGFSSSDPVTEKTLHYYFKEKKVSKYLDIF